MTTDVLFSTIKRNIAQNKQLVYDAAKAYMESHGYPDWGDTYSACTGQVDFVDLKPTEDGRYGVVINDFSFENVDVSKHADVVARQVYGNGSSETITEEFEFTKTTQDSFSYGFTESVKVGTKVTVKSKIPFIAGGEAEVSAEATLTANQEVTKTESRQWRIKSTVPVPPHTTVEASGVIASADLRAPFTATARVTKGRAFIWFDVRDHPGSVLECLLPLVDILPANLLSAPVAGEFSGAEGISVAIDVKEIGTL